MDASILAAADQIVNERQAKYGDVQLSFNQAATIATLMLTRLEQESLQMGTLRPSVIAKVMIALKLVRERNSPDNPDHLIDVAGYLRILSEVKP